MPGRDGAGPMGMGPMTGRGLGMCIRPNYSYGPGCGFAFRRGRFGRGRGFFATHVIDEMTPEQRKDLLRERRDVLKARLDAIEKQLEE
ncbi:MAG TPA: DUF5320 domain-containing protein [Firmicutes bacterium]|nr:DUF5320 domain-containing protein [Bacillota bacterium]